MPKFGKETKMTNQYKQSSLLTPEQEEALLIDMISTHIKEIPEPLPDNLVTAASEDESPTCQCCGRIASEWVCLDGAYYHLNVETCIRNTRYNRKIDIKQWLSNPVASTYKTVNVKVLAR